MWASNPVLELLVGGGGRNEVTLVRKDLKKACGRERDICPRAKP